MPSRRDSFAPRLSPATPDSAQIRQCKVLQRALLHSPVEIDPDSIQVVCQLDQYELPEIRPAWVTTLEVLPNGNYVIGNCHAGPGQPLLIEVDPTTKEVVWTFDHYDLLGNSVPNSQLLDVTTIR